MDYLGHNEPPRKTLAVFISITEHVATARPKDAYKVPWSQIVELFHWCSQLAQECKESAKLFSPTVFGGGRRLATNAEQSGMIAFDSDGGVGFGEIAKLWFDDLGFEGVLYTSARNSPVVPKWRLLIPLRELVDWGRYRITARAILRILRTQLPEGWDLDESKLSSESLFYLPGQYRIAKADDGTKFEPVNEFAYRQGAILTAAEWRQIADEIAPAPPAKVAPVAPPPVRPDYSLSKNKPWTPPNHIVDDYLSTGSNRHNKAFGTAVSLAMSAINVGYDLSVRELAAIMQDLEDRNHGRHPHKRAAIETLASDALDRAKSYVVDPAFKRTRWHDRYVPHIKETFEMIRQIRSKNDGSPRRS